MNDSASPATGGGRPRNIHSRPPHTDQPVRPSVSQPASSPGGPLLLPHGPPSRSAVLASNSSQLDRFEDSIHCCLASWASYALFCYHLTPVAASSVSSVVRYLHSIQYSISKDTPHS